MWGDKYGEFHFESSLDISSRKLYIKTQFFGYVESIVTLDFDSFQTVLIL
jgi:hypothetical protein